MQLYSFTELELTKLANRVKEGLISTLASEGILVEDAESISGTYAVTITQPSFFGRVWCKVRGLKGDDLVICVVRSTNWPSKTEKLKKLPSNDS